VDFGKAFSDYEDFSDMISGKALKFVMAKITGTERSGLKIQGRT
jgi:hypothetical protein